VAVVLLLAAVGCFTVGLRVHQEGLPGPVAPQFVPPSSSGGAALAPGWLMARTKQHVAARTKQHVAPPVVARSAPVALSIPSIDVTVAVSALGLNPDGTVQVPTDFQEPGWFRLGPSPGQVGSAVILGHVDSYLGPAVFFRLRSLLPGDKVEVSLADGVVVHFVVDGVAMYLKTQFPARQVYASHGYSALQLVTCGGEFDSNTGSYLSNIVVYTSLVGVTPTATAADHTSDQTSFSEHLSD
jgi:hypothetical protein